jgi:hypothetical protein
MERYKKRFIGSLAGMIKSDTGDWVKYDEFKEVLKSNEDSLFNVIKERNEEIYELRLDLQHSNDDCKELELRNTKLFALLVISTTLNFMTGMFLILTTMGKI